MMQEAVGGDPQREPEVFPGFPKGLVYRTPVSSLGLARLSKSLEGILAHDHSRGTLEKPSLQGLGERPAPVAVKRRPGLCRKAETVQIRAAYRIVTRMETRGGGLYTLDPDVVRQHSGQGLLELFGLPRVWKGRDRHLAGRVHPAVGSSRSDHRAMGTRELLQGRLQLPLNRALLGLDLPAVEGGSIILENQLEAIVLDGVHVRKVGGAQE